MSEKAVTIFYYDGRFNLMKSPPMSFKSFFQKLCRKKRGEARTEMKGLRKEGTSVFL